MQTRCLFLGALLCSLSPAIADIITRWDFNSPVPDASTTTGTTLPSEGVGTAIKVGPVTETFASGSSGDPAVSDNSAWSTSEYPAVNLANKSAGVRFDVSTAGYHRILVNYSQRNSNTASRYTRFQYSTNGGITFLELEAAANLNANFTNRTVDLSALLGVADNPLFAFRLVTEWEYTATTNGLSGYVATADGSTYGVGGTIRFDMVTVSGTILPGGNTPPTISSVPGQILRVGAISPEIPFTILDAESPATSLVLQAASSQIETVPVSGISFGGEGANRTVTLMGGAQPGTATVTLYVIDPGGKSNHTSFVVNVLPANTAPFISAISGTNVIAGQSLGPLLFTVGDAESVAETLVTSADSANPGLVPGGLLTLGGTGSNRTLAVSFTPGLHGVAPISVMVNDGTNTAKTAFALMVRPSVDVVFLDPFNYADGSLLTNSGYLWENRSGVEGQAQISGGQLLLTSTNTEDVIAKLAGGPYGRGSNVSLYAGFNLKLLALPKSNPGYFAHFSDGTALRARVFAGLSNAAPNFLRLFIANGSDTNTPHSLDLATNVFHRVVVQFDLDALSSRLWVNPASPEDPSVAALDAVAPVTRITGFGFRQDADLGTTLLVEDLRVGLTFASVLATTTSRPLLGFTNSAAGLVLTWSDPTFLLQSAPTPEGPFTPVNGAQSPHSPLTTTPARYYRLAK
jgi:hypothetical protein